MLHQTSWSPPCRNKGDSAIYRAEEFLRFLPQDLLRTVTCQTPRLSEAMTFDQLDDALALLEKANAELEPELPAGGAARESLARYAPAEKLAAYSRMVIDPWVGNVY